MPRQRIQYDSETYEFPDDFPERLKRFQKESGLSWSEMARCLGTYRHTVWRWAEGRARPNYHHRKALMELAGGMGLGHLLTAWILPDEARREKPAKDVPPGCERPGRKAERRRGGRHRRG